MWTSGDARDTWSVVWGDVNGDDWPDLVVGNLQEPDLVLLNDGAGMLGTSPAWSSSTSSTRSVTLADVDADGDLDLLRGAFGSGQQAGVAAANDLLLNAGSGQFGVPVWDPLVMRPQGCAGVSTRTGARGLTRSARSQWAARM